MQLQRLPSIQQRLTIIARQPVQEAELSQDLRFSKPISPLTIERQRVLSDALGLVVVMGIGEVSRLAFVRHSHSTRILRRFSQRYQRYHVLRLLCSAPLSIVEGFTGQQQFELRGKIVS